MAKAVPKVKRPGEDIDWDKVNVEITRIGKQITLPSEPGPMPLKVAVEQLLRLAADEEQDFRVFEVIQGFPFDAAVAFTKAMAQTYGWASPQTVYSFFGANQPQMLSIKTGPRLEDNVQCPMGRFMLPNVEGFIDTGFLPPDNDDYPGFYVTGVVKKKDRAVALELVTLARRLVKAESIYKGRPIKLLVDSEGDLQLGKQPEFLDVSDISEADLIFDDELMAQIDVNVLTPLRYSAECVRLGIPLKRGILLEGPYGTGKTLCARLVARIAQQHGWSFVLLENVRGLKAALEYANQYAPAVVFAEDIDRITEERDEDANDLCNTIDGVVSKTAQIMTVLTTNHVEKISKLMLRPGRLDAIVSMRAPGPDAVKRLIKHYARGALDPSTDLTEAGVALAGHIPAAVRECVERARLSMIRRRDHQIAGIDLVISANSMKAHMALLEEKKSGQTTPEKLAEALNEVILDGRGEKIDKLHDHFIG